MTAPIVVMAPHGRDAEVIRLVLGEAGLVALPCADTAAVCRALDGEVTALIASEAALAAGMEELVACLDAQPPWSDLPVLVLTTRGPQPSGGARRRMLARLGNVTLLAPPLHAEALQSAAQAAVRARQRQYRTRIHLAEIARINSRLEQEVEERTHALRAEMAERQRAEEGLRQAQKMEAVGQLTGGIAHDFNNLLQVMMGNLQTLRRRLDGDRALHRHVAMALEAGDRAAGLTRRLLAFARRQPLAPQSIDMAALVRAMVPLLKRSVGETIHVELGWQQDPAPAWADPNQLESALLNLTLNARDAMPEGGRLHINLREAVLDGTAAAKAGVEAGPYIVLDVADTGTGMPPEVLERAIEPFFTTKEVGQGSGLGLSQIDGFARQSDGFVAIRSRVGEGTIVTLHLPRCRTAGPPAPAQEPAAAPLHRSGHEPVLLVEDEPMVLMLWSEILAEQGYDVSQAPEPQAALDLLRSDRPFGLLVTDVGLPGMTGKALGEEARRLRPGLRVLFVTGYAQYAEFGPGGMEPGMRLLQKPVPVDQLLQTVREMLDEP